MQISYIISFILGGVFTSLIIFWVTSSEKRFLKNSNQNLTDEVHQKTDLILELTTQLTKTKSDLNNLIYQQDEKNLEITKIKEQFKLEFENLANKIFEEKSNKFTEQNQQNITSILNPLNEKIKDFEKKVTEAYIVEGKERASLKEQITQLTQLNQKMSLDTQNLTLALKGDSKTQGNWGEMVLESILEKSGLVKDREYVIQSSVSNEEGKRYQPDVIINLPDGKVLIIDSKVSLTAYEACLSSLNEDDHVGNLKKHLLSIKNHIKSLGEKNYHNLYTIKSLDFVLLFIPIESAFALAIQHERGLFDEALSKNIVLVCPSTLLATMKTVANIWRNEKSAQNANEIAKLGGELYDKLVGILDAMNVLDLSIKSSQDKYNNIMTKMTGARGIVKSAMKLKDLGAKTNKNLDSKITDLIDEVSTLE